MRCGTFQYYDGNFKIDVSDAHRHFIYQSFSFKIVEALNKYLNRFLFGPYGMLHVAFHENASILKCINGILNNNRSFESLFIVYSIQHLLSYPFILHPNRKS